MIDTSQSQSYDYNHRTVQFYSHIGQRFTEVKRLPPALSTFNLKHSTAARGNIKSLAIEKLFMALV